MKFISGPSIDVAVHLSGVSNIINDNPGRTLPSLLLNSFHEYLRMSVPSTLVRYKSSVQPESLRRNDEYFYSEPLKYTEYDVAADVRKFSHSIAAFFSYINGHPPSVTHGDKSVLHVKSDAVVMDSSTPLYQFDPGSFCGVTVYHIRETNPGWAPFQNHAYEIFNSDGTVRDEPSIAGTGYTGSVDILHYFTALEKACKVATDSLYLCSSPDAPKVVVFMYWDSFYQHSVCDVSVSVIEAGRAYTIRWTEWYANGYGEFRKLKVSLDLSVIDDRRANDFGYSPHAFSIQLDFGSEETWYQYFSTPQPVFGSLLEVNPPHWGISSQTIRALNTPLTMPSRGEPRRDMLSRVTPLYSDVRRALEKARVGIGYSSAKLDKQLDDKFTNWVEFCSELEQLFALLPQDAMTSQWARFLTYLPQGRLHYILTLLEILASGYLATIFGLVPLLDAASQIGPIAEDLRSKLQSLMSARIRSGKVRLVPHTSFFDTCVLDYPFIDAVSACDISPNVALQSPVVILDRLGILPKPSRLWDLKQFSWLVDMFINVGGRIQAVESIMVLLWWGARNFTHSVTIEASIDSLASSLSSVGLRLHGTDSTIHGYMRETSALVPMVALRTDFWSADTTSHPNWLVVLSLLLLFLL